jgi:hypothetical protein
VTGQRSNQLNYDPKLSELTITDESGNWIISNRVIEVQPQGCANDQISRLFDYPIRSVTWWAVQDSNL